MQIAIAPTADVVFLQGDELVSASFALGLEVETPRNEHFFLVAVGWFFPRHLADRDWWKHWLCSYEDSTLTVLGFRIGAKKGYY